MPVRFVTNAEGKEGLRRTLVSIVLSRPPHGITPEQIERDQRIAKGTYQYPLRRNGVSLGYLVSYMEDGDIVVEHRYDLDDEGPSERYAWRMEVFYNSA